MTMKKKQKNPNIELRSEEVQELMGKVPPVILKVGISIILLFVVLILGACFCIKCKEVVSIPIEVRNLGISIRISPIEMGQILKANTERSFFVRVGDTLVTMVSAHENKLDTTYITAPMEGVAFADVCFQRGDEINPNMVLYVIADSVYQDALAKSLVNDTLGKKLQNGMKVKALVNGVLLTGKITQLYSLRNGFFSVMMKLKQPENKCGVFYFRNIQTSAEIELAEHSLFEKFFLERLKAKYPH